MRASPRAWWDELEPAAPDVVAVWRQIDPDNFSDDYSAAREELRRRAGPGSAGTGPLGRPTRRRRAATALARLGDRSLVAVSVT